MLYSLESVLGICWIGKTIEEIAEPGKRAESRAGRRTPQSENARSTSFAIPRRLASRTEVPCEAFRQPFFTQKLLGMDRKARFARIQARCFDRAPSTAERDLGVSQIPTIKTAPTAFESLAFRLFLSMKVVSFDSSTLNARYS